MHASTRTTVAERRVLIVAPPGRAEEDLLARFDTDVDVRIVHSRAEALAALDGGSFDSVVIDPKEFVAIQGAAVGERAAAALEAIGQGMCVVDADGRLIWTNAVMRSHPDELIIGIQDACSHMLSDSTARDGTSADPSEDRKLNFDIGGEQHFEVSITPIGHGGEKVRQAAVVVWDVTRQRRLQKKIDAIDLAGRELVRLDVETAAGMTLEARISLLEQKILRYLHDLLSFDNFAVLLIDKKTNRLEIVLQHGMSERSRDLDLVASPDNNGISGYVATAGRSYLCPDTSKDPRYLTGLETARSSLTVPLRLNDRIIGVFDIESDEPAAFNEADRQFVEILAGYIAIALNILDLLVSERYETTGRFADDVNAEIAGPVNDIVAEAGTLVDEYIGDEGLRQRLRGIRDNANEIKEIIKEVASPKAGLLGRRGDTPVEDPLLAGKRVLVADDEEVMRETVGAVLRRHGCTVEIACDGMEAVGLLEQHPYDLVLADIKMPHKNGYEVFAVAHQTHAGIRVILMTGFGYDPSHSIIRARREGLSAVLFKPFKVDLLIEEVHNALQPHV
ncbi:MAG: response regulator [Phycisphaerae bacterium]